LSGKAALFYTESTYDGGGVAHVSLRRSLRHLGRFRTVWSGHVQGVCQSFGPVAMDRWARHGHGHHDSSMACARGGAYQEAPRSNACGDCLSSGGEFLMLDLILILGITLSTAGLVGAPFMHRQKPCREEDASVSSSAGLLLQRDTLYTAIR